MLDRVAVVGVELGPLAPYRADPERGHAQPLQVVELAGQPGERAALPALAGLAPGGGVGRGVLRGGGSVEERPAGLTAVAEPVRQQEVQELVAPLRWARVDAT